MKGKKVQSSPPRTTYPLEDYSMERYREVANWILKNNSSAFWDDHCNNMHGRDFLKAIMDTTQNISIACLNLELTLLRRLINDDSTNISKEYAILDFNYEAECSRHMMLQVEIRDSNRIRQAENLPTLQQYVNGNLPTAGCPWYLFLVNIPEWKIHIYDCSNNPHTTEEINTHSNAIIDITTALLMSSKFDYYRRYVKKKPNKTMEIDIIPYQPSIDNGPNCGVFLLKYIECFVLGHPVEIVSAYRMILYRRKIAVDICFNEYFLHPR